MNNLYLNNNGIILILILWILVILTTIALGFGHSMMVEYRIASYNIDKLKTMELAKAGIERGIAELASDSTNIGSLTSPWRLKGMNSYQNVSLGEGTYTLYFGDLSQDNQSGYGQPGYGMVDENSKLNLNSATESMLMQLPNADQTIADSILVWRSNTTNNQQYPQGADDSYYTQLNPSYNCKHSPFDTLEEVLLVRGVTPEILFGEDTNLNGVLPNVMTPNDPNSVLALGWYPYVTVFSYDLNQALDGTPRVNITQASANAMLPLTQHGLTNADITNIVSYRRSNRLTRLGDLLNVQGITIQKFGQISDYITVSNNPKIPGLINVNTASAVVLGTIPGMNTNLIQQIIQQRIGTPFNNLGDVAQSVGKSTFPSISNLVTVRSAQFTIQSVGRLNDKPAFTRLIAVVDRSVIPIKILYYRDISSLGPGG